MTEWQDNDGVALSVVNGSGKFGIGDTTPAALFTVGDGDDFQIDTTGGVIANGLATTGTINRAVCMVTTTNVVRTSTSNCIASLRELKDDINDLSLDLDTLLSLRPVEFDWNDTYWGNNIHDEKEVHDLGFIAEEVEDVNPLLAQYDSDGSLRSVKYERLTALLTKSIQQIVNTVDLKNAIDLDSPSIFINNQQNVGIGNIDPQYKLEVTGDIAANSFINISTKDAKQDISYLSENDNNTFLEQIKNLKIAKYHYKNESGSDPLRIGLIAEDSPIEILSKNGKGIDLYKLTTMNVGAIQSQQKTIDQLKGIVNNISNYYQVLSAKVKTRLLEAENIIVSNNLTAKNAVIEQISVITANISNLAINNKIVSPIVETQTLTVNTKAQIPKLETQEIKPTEKELTIDLSENNNEQKGELSKLIIKGLEGKKAVEIDAAGNATFSGTLASNKLETNQASISGKLIAKEIESETISELRNRIENAVNNSQQSSVIQVEDDSNDINEIQKLLADIRSQPLSDTDSYQAIQTDITIPSSTSSSQIAYQDNNVFDGISVTGTTNLFTAYVSNSLTAGKIYFEDNKITSLDFELKISALSSINLLDGEVIISKNGGLTTRSTLTAKAGIKTNKIEPINEDENVFIKNLETNSIDISDKYLEATSSSSIISKDENFTKNGLFAPAIETSAQIAGVGMIKSNDEEIVIYNDSVKENSLVYLTPIENPQNNILTVVKKEICLSEAPQQPNECKPYFKVASNSSDHEDIKFNWLIIN